jgi:WD40 repeat protein
VEAGRGSNDLIVVDAGDLAVDPPDVPKVLRISAGAAFLVAPFASVPLDASEDYHGRVWVAVTPSEIVRVEIDGTVTPVLTVPFALSSLEVHPDGKRLVLGADDGVHVLDPETGDDVHHAVGAVKDATADRFGNIFAVTDAHRVV